MPYSVLMLNRWTNSLESKEEILSLMIEFEKAIVHPESSERAREESLDYLSHQRARLVSSGTEQGENDNCR